jgi:hypothetical protein
MIDLLDGGWRLPYSLPPFVPLVAVHSALRLRFWLVYGMWMWIVVGDGIREFKDIAGIPSRVSRSFSSRRRNASVHETGCGIVSSGIVFRLRLADRP